MRVFSKSPADRVSVVGEVELIRRIRGWLGDVCPPAPAGIGDDCAVVPPLRGAALVTVDPVVYGRHFDDSVPPAAVGAKLLKRNLSDIAAMGGRPTAAVVALAIDRRTSVKWLAGFYRGLAAVARRHGVSIVGGDVAEASGVVVATLTQLGQPAAKKILSRQGARAGDLIFVTGVLGRSLQSGHHHRFQPRLAEGAWLARQRAVRSMIDVSDGLAKDLQAITPPGCYPWIPPDSIPLRARASLRQALADGEDYELLFSASNAPGDLGFIRRWGKAFPQVPLSCLGIFLPLPRRAGRAIDLSRYTGYEHLR